MEAAGRAEAAWPDRPLHRRGAVHRQGPAAAGIRIRLPRAVRSHRLSADQLAGRPCNLARLAAEAAEARRRQQARRLDQFLRSRPVVAFTLLGLVVEFVRLFRRRVQWWWRQRRLLGRRRRLRRRWRVGKLVRIDHAPTSWIVGCTTWRGRLARRDAALVRAERMERSGRRQPAAPVLGCLPVRALGLAVHAAVGRRHAADRRGDAAAAVHPRQRRRDARGCRRLAAAEAEAARARPEACALDRDARQPRAVRGVPVRSRDRRRLVVGSRLVPGQQRRQLSRRRRIVRRRRRGGLVVRIAMHLRSRLSAAVLALALLLGAVPAFALNFPALSGRVVDQADILDQSARIALTEKLASLEASTTDQLVVATVRSLEGTSVEDYANRLFREWKLGQKDKNNGVLLLVAPNERKVRIEVGYGLEGTLTDARSRLIIESFILPRFRERDFA